MAFQVISVFFLLLSGIFAAENDDIAFDKNYEFIWGNDHILSLNQGRELQLTLDNRSGNHLHLLIFVRYANDIS